MLWRQIVICMFLVVAFQAAWAANDTIYIDKLPYTIHQIRGGETLYTIAQKYQVDIASLKKANRITDDQAAIKNGDLLIIPLNTPKPVAIQKKDAGVSTVKSTPKTTHTVKQGETLFAIAKQYHTSTAEIKAANGMVDDKVSIGQELIISTIGNDKVSSQPKKPIAENNAALTKTTPQPQTAPMENIGDPKLDMAMLNSLKQSFANEEVGKGTVEVTRGMAVKMADQGTENASKFYALHKTAAVGSVLKVRNLMNNRIAYVKVIGKLPDTGENKNLVIKISGGTVAYLKALDQKFQIEVTEYK
ncbi:MAG: LysM peptidoglycan-binding domain-containing protein [Chitinophagales bacterium]|nr:LysM peptidoglycan-binding domain-containing protein [Chitinophagales bacterium]